MQIFVLAITYRLQYDKLTICCGFYPQGQYQVDSVNKNRIEEPHSNSSSNEYLSVHEYCGSQTMHVLDAFNAMFPVLVAKETN